MVPREGDGLVPKTNGGDEAAEVAEAVWATVARCRSGEPRRKRSRARAWDWISDTKLETILID